MMTRIISLVVVALVMATVMLVMAMPAFAQGGAAGNCGPPGQSHRQAAKVPGKSAPEAWGEPPGQSASKQCAPGHLKDEEPI